MSSVTPVRLPEHRPLLQVTWNDPESTATGYVVVDRLICGVATGGMRTRAGCTMDEVADLASEMSLKTALYGLPVGGAKGGIDYPADAPDVDDVRERFLQAVKPLLDTVWTTAGDLGTPQARLDDVFARAGLGTSSMRAPLQRTDDPGSEAMRVGMIFGQVDEDGLVMSDMIGGYGVAESVLQAMVPLALEPTATRAVVQGFGAMGGSTALYLHKAGVKVVGLVDARGLVVNSTRGLDVPTLLAHRQPGGVIDRSLLRLDDHELPSEDWLDVDTDVLVPAAVGYCIDETNWHRVRARLISEAANVPITAAAEYRLVERGVVVVPDFVANAGAAAWAWWVMFGAVHGPADSRQMLSAHIRPVVASLMQARASGQPSLRATAREMAERNLAIAEAQYGGVLPTMPLFTAGAAASAASSLKAIA